MEKIICSQVDSCIRLLANEYDLVSDYHDDARLAIAFDRSFHEDLQYKLVANGTRTVGGPRLPKGTQARLLNRLGINHPKTYSLPHMKGIQCVEDLDAAVDADEFVYKLDGGARGIGVAKMTRKQYYDLYNAKCTDNNNFTNMVSDVFKETSAEDRHHISMHGYLIQELVNVRREFRLLYFREGEHIMYERKKQPGAFIANLSAGAKPVAVPVSLLPEGFLTNVKTLFDTMNYPFGSVDVYEDVNRNFGIFEFQMEFTYSGFNHKDIRTRMLDCVKLHIDGN